MKKYFVTMLAAVFSVCAATASKPTSKLMFDASKGVAGSVTMPQGKIVNYTAYTNLYFVTNIEDSTYQYMNVFVPDGATASTPIFMRNYVGGYMASKPSFPSASDATGRALSAGYVVVIPGARGWNASIQQPKSGKEIFTGRAPKGLLDLKAAVRYLRLFDKEMPGDAERIITDGTSAGGAMSSLLGATGNQPVYEEMLKAMGAADTRDDIWAAVCYCPIIDLDHADMAYEWLYGCTNRVNRPLSDEQMTVSDELAAGYLAYLESLQLKKADGTALDRNNYMDYLKGWIIRSAQEAKDAGASIPDSLGFVLDRKQGEYIVDVDMPTYLNYVVSTIPLKTPPAFDSEGVAGGRPSPENQEFGNETGNSVNFTAYSLRKSSGNAQAEVTPEVARLVRLMNPMNWIEASNSTVAPHWYIRHGARDRDTSFQVPVNLATKLENAGKDVNFKLAWNRPHCGDYALAELFDWIKQLVEEE